MVFVFHFILSITLAAMDSHSSRKRVTSALAAFMSSFGSPSNRNAFDSSHSRVASALANLFGVATHISR